MILSPADRSTQTWQRILTHLKESKQLALERLAHEQSDAQTNKLRGEVACLERLIQLDNQPDLHPEPGRLTQRVGTF